MDRRTWSYDVTEVQSQVGLETVITVGSVLTTQWDVKVFSFPKNFLFKALIAG